MNSIPYAYPTAAQQNAVAEQPIDPRESGNHLAQLQLASELSQALLARLRSIADRIQSADHAPEVGGPAHMSLLAFPGDIIAAAKEAHIHCNRIEGALGV